MELKENGLYIVEDAYFAVYKSSNFMWNKDENRPHFYAVKDPSGTIWMIPMSSRVEKYRKLINKEESKRGIDNCVYYHIGLIAGKECVFVISGMFPVTEKYISRSYYIGNVPYVVKDRLLVRKLRSKAVRFLRLLEQHQIRDANQVLKIRKDLLSDK